MGFGWLCCWPRQPTRLSQVHGACQKLASRPGAGGGGIPSCPRVGTGHWAHRFREVSCQVLLSPLRLRPRKKGLLTLYFPGQLTSSRRSGPKSSAASSPSLPTLSHMAHQHHVFLPFSGSFPNTLAYPDASPSSLTPHTYSGSGLSGASS